MIIDDRKMHDASSEAIQGLLCLEEMLNQDCGFMTIWHQLLANLHLLDVLQDRLYLFLVFASCSLLNSSQS
jgi:hypothetical protein